MKSAAGSPRKPPPLAQRAVPAAQAVVSAGRRSPAINSSPDDDAAVAYATGSISYWRFALSLERNTVSAAWEPGSTKNSPRDSELSSSTQSRSPNGSATVSTRMRYFGLTLVTVLASTHFLVRVLAVGLTAQPTPIRKAAFSLAEQSASQQQPASHFAAVTSQLQSQVKYVQVAAVLDPCRHVQPRGISASFFAALYAVTWVQFTAILFPIGCPDARASASATSPDARALHTMFEKLNAGLCDQTEQFLLSMDLFCWY